MSKKSVSPFAFCLTPTKKPKGVRLNRLMMLTVHYSACYPNTRQGRGGIYVLKMSISATTMYYSIREKAKTKIPADAPAPFVTDQ